MLIHISSEEKASNDGQLSGPERQRAARVIAIATASANAHATAPPGTRANLPRANMPPACRSPEPLLERAGQYREGSGLRNICAAMARCAMRDRASWLVM
jgi:hypothetical protein